MEPQRLSGSGNVSNGNLVNDMCGIAGILTGSSGAVGPAALERMAAAMRLRGPDDHAIHVDDEIGMVHTRLTIRDLTDRGRCPMPNEDGSVRVVFNGEIYNWRELRDVLAKKGHSFCSACDSEVLVHGYEEWGEDLFPRLRGMFAIGIWDAEKHRLLLARDRVGEKPLFYFQEERRFIFASTLGAILEARRVKPQIDHNALTCYFAHSFVPATHTAFRGIKVFPPACYATIDSSHALQICRYWNFPDVKPKTVSLSKAETELERLLGDCVERCLDADVPVGVFLSGGVDSSLVAALAARYQTGLPAFSIGFNAPENNELPYARMVAEAVDLDHRIRVLEVRDVIELLPPLVAAYDQPFGDASAVPTYAVSKLAREQVKVCLSGDGGDESFAGYWRAQAVTYASRYGRIVPRLIRQRIARNPPHWLGSLGKRFAAANELSLGTPGCGYTNAQSWYGELNEIVGPRLKDALQHECVTCRVGGAHSFRYASVLQRALFDDFQVQLPDDYLRKVDVASMAASLEVRSPLLDVELLEAAWRLPDKAKLHWGERKYLLKRVAAKLLPRSIIYRPKMGFAMPLSRWFRKDLGNYLEGLLEESVSLDDGWLQRKPIFRALEEHRNGARDNHTRLWLVLWFELWLRGMRRSELIVDQRSGIAQPCMS